MLSESQAWQITDEISSAVSVSSFREYLSAVYLVGSLTRGDFFPLKSEVDLLFVLTEKASRLSDDEIAQALQFVKSIDARWRPLIGRTFPCVDIGPWIHYSEIPFRSKADFNAVRHLAELPGRQYISTYAFDFVENGKILYGTDIRSELAVFDPAMLAPVRVNHLTGSLLSYMGSVDREWARREAKQGFRVKLGAMSIARNLFLCYGPATLLKQPVFEGFETVVPPIAGKEFFSSWLVPEYLAPDFFEDISDENALSYFEGCRQFAQGAACLVGLLKP